MLSGLAFGSRLLAPSSRIIWYILRTLLKGMVPEASFITSTVNLKLTGIASDLKKILAVKRQLSP